MNITKPALENLEKRYEKEKEKILKYAPLDGTIIFDNFRTRFKDYLDDEFTKIRLETNPQFLNGILVKIHKFDSFFELLPMIEYLESVGFECKGSEDYPEIGRRTFSFKKASIGADLKLMCFVSEDAKGCHRVEDGVETKYKIVCG